MKRRLFFSLLLFFNAATNAFSQPDLKADNSSRYLGDKRWEWTVFLRASNETLSRITSVTYTLHKSFSPHIITVKNVGDRNAPFGLTANGWGEFTVFVQVNFNNGTAKYLEHHLTFRNDPTSQDISAGSTVKKIADDWWSWTIYIQGPDNILDQVKCVEYKLHETFGNPVQLICDRGAGNAGFPLTIRGWGTFTIKIKVIYRNGEVQLLSHDLKFK